MATFFKDTNDDTIKRVAEDIAKAFITKGINDNQLTDINAAAACYVEFYNHSVEALLMQRENNKKKNLKEVKILVLDKKKYYRKIYNIFILIY